MSPDFQPVPQPRRWFLIPLVLGFLLIVLSILLWYFPWLLLLMLVVPMFFIGLFLFMIGLMMALDLVHYNNLRDRMQTMRSRYWPRNPFDR
jgi:hypothetical protein